jgi:3-oxoacyl-(acyl-carrier-protein) synthase
MQAAIAIAITGIGVVSPAGTTSAAFWEQLLAQDDLRTGWARGDLSPYPFDQVVPISDAVWRAIGCADDSATISALAAFALNGARQEAQASALQRVGCVLSSTTSGVEELERCLQDRGGQVRTLGASQQPLRAIDGAHLLDCGTHPWTGPSSVLSTACSSGLLAIGLAIDTLAAGEADAMVAGGIDVLLEYTVCGFSGLRLTTADRCRPFSSERKGVLLSEGAVFFFLEPLANALQRKATIHAVVSGYGISCDADHVTAPNPDGVARAIRQAIDSSGVAREAIDAIFAHGTGSLANDAAEVNALRCVFGDVPIPPITAIKSVMGHPQAAAGAFSLLAGVLALQQKCLPATAGLSSPDPALGDIDVVCHNRPLSARHVMVNAFGFGGNNCVMILSDPATLTDPMHEVKHAR